MDLNLDDPKNSPKTAHTLRAHLIHSYFHLRKRWYFVRRIYFDNFVFIHINKTGGSSISRALKLPLEHKTACEKREELGRLRWKNRYKFSVIRNPWDKIVSLFAYRVQTNQTDLQAIPISFDEWVHKVFVEKDPTYYDKPKMFMPQKEWVCNGSGDLLVDHLCRFENLSDDFTMVCKHLGKTATLGRFKASNRGPYEEYYTSKTRRIITDAFKSDIHTFTYTF